MRNIIYILFLTFLIGTAGQSQGQNLELNCRIAMIYIGDSAVYVGSGNIPGPDRLTLTPKNNKIKIILNSYGNDTVEYSSRLVNHNKEWTPWSNLREITFCNLKPGKYVFQAKAKDINDVTSDPITLEFKVKPPFLQSLAGIVTAIVSIIAATGLAVTFVRRREANKRKNLMADMDKCMNSLQEANSRIAQQQENHNKNVQVLSLLSKSGQNIIKNYSLKEIYKTTYEEINKFFEADNIGIGIYNGPHNSIDFSSFIMNGEAMPFARYNLDIVNNMKVYCYLNSKTIVMDDYQKQVDKYINTNEFKVDTLITGSAVYMPLFNDDMAMGVLMIHSKNTNYFTSYHLGIIHNIASYLETAILNFSTERKAQRKQKILEDQTINLQKTYNNLKKSQEQLQIMSVALTNTDNSVVIFNKEGNMIWVNNGFTKVYGYQFEEYIKESAHYTKAIRQTEAIQYFDKVFQDKQSIAFSLRHLNKDGNEIWTQSTITPVLDSKGEIIQIVAVDTDISLQKKVEEEMLKQRNEIESKNKDLTKSIEYAYTIQSALMSGANQLHKVFKKSFLITLPKDIVSGDFFWMGEKFGRKYVALCDCAGHGVPGAFVSMMGKVFLDEILQSARVEDAPSDIIRQLNNKINVAFNSLNNKVGGIDGMDMALLILNSRHTLLQYAGAYRPLFMVRDGELSTVMPDKCSVGNIPLDSDFQFEDHELSLKPNDLLLLCSDGYADQFGYINGKKMGRKNFCNLITEASKLSEADDMAKFLYNKHLEWRGNLEQVDDISILGLIIAGHNDDEVMHYYDDDEDFEDEDD